MPARRRIAVILAGGVGARMGADGPKQLIQLAGRSILARSVEVFVPLVDQIVVVMAPDHRAEARRVLDELGAHADVVAGGRTRCESTRLALHGLATEPDDAKVLVHDAARPLVDERIITGCLSALDRHDAVTAAVTSADTMAMLRDAGDDGPAVVDSYLPRERLIRIQTPQGFRLGLLRAAHEQAAQAGRFDFTDDCQVVAAFDPQEPIVMVEGAAHNLKVTHPADLAVAQEWLARNRPGQP